jgi:coenzyme PQQ precursor peptide PqqA
MRLDFQWDRAGACSAPSAFRSSPSFIRSRDAARGRIGSSYKCTSCLGGAIGANVARGREGRLVEMQREWNMAWSTPEVVEVCVGMEVTSYSSAEV